MKSFSKISLITLASILISCSSTTWIVESQEEVDRGDYKLLDTKLFIQKSGSVSPEFPIVQFQLKSANTIEYVRRIKTDRYIQKYRPRFGYVAFGVGSAALAGYSAFAFSDPAKKGQKIALIGASAALTGISFLNMKPIGAPQHTGESRLLRKTGTYIEVDTLDAAAGSSESASYSISYQNQELSPRTKREFSNNSFIINLGEELNPDAFSGDEDITIDLSVDYRDSSYNYQFPISSVFEPFVVVSSAVTALRNEPEINSRNILTDLAQGSQLKLVSREGDWYKVLYGISENWVSAGDVKTIWRPAEFSQQLSVVAIPNVPFGSVDVERDIPRLAEDNRDRWGFILSNQKYDVALPENTYAHRDGELVEKYMNSALGIVPNQTIKFLDMSGNQTARNGFNRLTSRINNRQVELLVYLNGYAEVDPETNLVYFLGTSSDSSARRINLNSMFDGFANLPARKLFIVADIDFVNQPGKQQALETLAAAVTTQVPNSAVVFASETDQRSYLYTDPNGPQKRHSIFTYYFADALKQRNTKWEDIRTHLERNVSFTSRSIFNVPQDIRFFGSDSLSIVN